MFNTVLQMSCLYVNPKKLVVIFHYSLPQTFLEHATEQSWTTDQFEN